MWLKKLRELKIKRKQRRKHWKKERSHHLQKLLQLRWLKAKRALQTIQVSEDHRQLKLSH
jgi:hypothetical protein